MPDLQDRIADAVLTIRGVDEFTSHMIARKLIEVFGIREQTEKIGVDCPDCDQFRLRRWVTDWEALDG